MFFEKVSKHLNQNSKLPIFQALADYTFLIKFFYQLIKQ